MSKERKIDRLIKQFFNGKDVDSKIIKNVGKFKIDDFQNHDLLSYTAFNGGNLRIVAIRFPNNEFKEGFKISNTLGDTLIPL